MSDGTAREATDHEFAEVEPGEAVVPQYLDLADLFPVNVRVTAELGETRMLVKDILALKQGSVVTLDSQAGEMTDVFVNGLPLGKGEVVVIADVLHVRIAEIAGASEIEKEKT